MRGLCRVCGRGGFGRVLGLLLGGRGGLVRGRGRETGNAMMGRDRRDGATRRWRWRRDRRDVDRRRRGNQRDERDENEVGEERIDNWECEVGMGYSILLKSYAQIRKEEGAWVRMTKNSKPTNWIWMKKVPRV